MNDLLKGFVDWLFDPVSTRSIHVDSRYVLWYMDRVDGVHHLLEEMGVEPAFADESDGLSADAEAGDDG